MTACAPRLLGIAASLRNARWGGGNRRLVEQLAENSDKASLMQFLTRESELHLENFLQAGRREGRTFLEIYRNLAKSNGQSGLSNSEVALAAALWAAAQEGAEVAHLSLAEYFDTNGNLRHPERLRQALLEADGLLLSGPVYFGDRGSLAESLIDFIARDRSLREGLAGRLYGGIAVGAKRNGGQETTLIYQMIDMLGLGMLAVGNDSDTTAQYGGTGHAGDVGTMHKDMYGIDTSMGVGRRMAKVLPALATTRQLNTLPGALFLILEDVDGIAQRIVDALAAQLRSHMKATVVDLTRRSIKRCIACDICPTHIDIDDVYRCIIKSENDDLPELHANLLHHDALIPVVATARDRSRMVGNYQTFIERTRYLRRGDYAWSDLLVAPITLTESAGYDTYSIRLMTSFLRHHTVMSRPLVGRIVGDAVVDVDQLVDGLKNAIAMAGRLAAGRLALSVNPGHRYHPVGYVLSANKDAEDDRLKRRRLMVDDREARMAREASIRLRRNAVGS
ncbi:MAG TPA: NAD(P)H-dependent oxidoreductase [Stellaceae bacterium]|nr:NAD(P)H-dependent oxidoreductase [Stellaceae bacterium]